MKKIFMSPFFVPAAFLILWLSFMGTVYYGFPENVLKVTVEGELIENITHIGYVLLIGMLLLLREEGIQHHLSRTDTTPFKSRFFLNPNNPLSEKIIFGLVLLVVAGAVAYLAVKYSKHLVGSFFKLNPVTWSIAVLCTVGVCSKIVDRFPSNWKKAHGGVPLADETYALCQLVEESGEMFLPYIAIAALYQFRLQKEDSVQRN